MGLLGNRDGQAFRTAEAADPFLRKVESAVFGLPVKGEVQGLLVGICPGIKERGIGRAGKTEEAAESPAAELFEDGPTGRDLPIRDALVPPEGNRGSELGSAFRRRIEKGMKGGAAIIHEMRDKTLVDEAFKDIERQAFLAEINERP
jgi:hypothetical protein